MDILPSTVRAGLVALVLAAFAPLAGAQPLPEEPTSGRAPLSSSEVSNDEVESVAEIIVALEDQRAKLEREYGAPKNMSSNQRRKAQLEIMRRRQALMQKKTIQEDIDAGRLELIMISARKDSVLHDRVHTAIEEERKETE